jgi:hypothetical protein
MTEKAETLFKEIAQFVADSRHLLGEGATIELAGLDVRVRDLCEKVLTLSEEDRARYTHLLDGLLAELKQLGDDLKLQQEAVVNEIRYLSSHKKANIAYKTADATDGFKKNEDE